MLRIPTTEVGADAVPSVSRLRRWPIRLLRATAVLFLLDSLLQAALAGLFVTGDVGLLAWHAANAQMLSALVVVQTIAAVVIWRSLRGPWWPPALTVGLLGLLSIQQGLGESRMLGGHIPLGMAIFGTGAALTYWAFSFQPAGRPRAEREADK
ncbi:hypothetical protein [Streptomyces violascens]|uniref:Integral membrane protein n=1 Tax=Streptomyces violascens TaxID=67381 RepID=A0ABQ3QRX9_9ACTN|nr:hypothetical protein [Streptomyces violascens]GGT84772.1 hypothetical protein GCM10010289_00370 [Streptomyces violascens]GHI40005.1 hypothetical protein Sviol_44130 [Streptomyces violascens]